MTKNLLIASILFSTILLACKENSTKDTVIAGNEKDGQFVVHGNKGKTAKFTVDGTSYSGKVSTQTFADNQFSILCEVDEPFSLLQITVSNKEDLDGNLAITNSFMSMEPKTVHVSLGGNAFGDQELKTYTKSTGEVMASKNKIVLKDVQLTNGDGKSVFVKAEISF